MDFANVLLVHGLGSTFEHNWRRPGWVDVFEAEGLAATPVRLPGHDGADLDHSPADAVLAAAHAQPDETAAVGFSAGALAVLDAAATEPSRFSRIAVLGIGDHVLRPAAGPAGSLAAALREPTEPDDVRQRTLWRHVRRSGNDPESVAMFLESTPRTVTIERLWRITCPVLVVIGSRDEAMPADGLVAALRDARLAVLPGVDHLATVSALGTIDAVTQFLAGR